jgi:hypothetical protein
MSAFNIKTFRERKKSCKRESGGETPSTEEKENHYWPKEYSSDYPLG